MDTQKKVFFWGGIIVAVLAILALIQMMRVNAPEAEKEAAPVVRYTSGSVIEGPVTLQPGEFLSFRMNLNRPATLTGNFDSGDRKIVAGLFVLDDPNFEKWKNGDEFKSVIQTGMLPAVEVSRKIGPGVFHLVFDNRENKNEAVNLTTSFSVD